jgi:predicted ATPase
MYQSVASVICRSFALAQIADLFPVLRERLPDLPELPDVPPEERRNRQIDGLCDLALALARTLPLVIALDDAQWADDATLATVGRLARQASRRALLLILAYRADELSDNPALHNLLRTLGRDMLLRPLVLGRLDASAVAELLAGLAGVETGRVAHLAPPTGRQHRRQPSGVDGNGSVVAGESRCAIACRTASRP